MPRICKRGCRMIPTCGAIRWSVRRSSPSLSFMALRQSLWPNKLSAVPIRRASTTRATGVPYAVFGKAGIASPGNYFLIDWAERLFVEPRSPKDLPTRGTLVRLHATADGTLHVEHYVRNTQIAERGKLDMIFFADGAGIRQGDNPRGSLSRTGRDMVELEPMTLLPALAMVTKHVGLVTTASTTYNEP